MPLLSYPFALLGLAAVPALVVIYFLYNRFRRREVSSVFLWRHLGRQAAGHSRIRALLPPPAFWLECLALLFLALAATDLCWRSRQTLRPLIVVLDDSLSMQAVVDGRSAQQRARDALERELRSLAPSSVRLVLAGRVPRLGARFPPQALGDALKGWHCANSATDLDKALLLARTHAENARLLVLTDQPPTTAITEPMVKWITVGRTAPNAGIVNAVRAAATPDTDRLLVEVRMFGAAAVAPILRVTADGRELTRETVSAPANASRLVTLSVPASTGRIQAELGEDALAADNRCELPAAWRPRLRVEVTVTRKMLRAALERAIRAAGLQSPPATQDAQLVLTDAAATPPQSGGLWTCRFTLPAQSQALVGPFVMNRAHPLCDGLDLNGVVWSGAAAPGDGLPVILAGDVPLVRETELPGGARLLDVALDPERSTLLESPNWPVFIWNLLQWRARSAPGFGTNRALCGQWVRVTVPQPGERTRLRLPDGTETELRASPNSRETGFVPEVAGLYRAANSAGEFELACLPGNSTESDLTGCASGTFGGWQTRIAVQHGYWSSAALFGLLALAALLGHAALVYRASVRTRETVPVP